MTTAAHDHVGNPMFRWPRLYDLMLRIFWRDGEHEYRRSVIELAGIRRGERILDVGCGTGTLAIAAAGAAGKVFGVDPSAEMIGRATAKAAQARVPAEFRQAQADHLPFSDDSFDCLLSTTVLHCIAPDRLTRSIGEMIRVLRPGGRIFLVDFGGPADERSTFVSRMPPHRDFDVRNVVPLLRQASATDVRAGGLGFSDLYFVRAIKG